MSGGYLLCKCGRYVYCEPPNPAKCRCGRVYIWKMRSGHYVLAREP
jgi:hypothetical protein